MTLLAKFLQVSEVKKVTLNKSIPIMNKIKTRKDKDLCLHFPKEITL